MDGNLNSILYIYMLQNKIILAVQAILGARFQIVFSSKTEYHHTTVFKYDKFLKSISSGVL